MRLQHAVITLAVLAVTMVAFIGAMRVSPAEPREAVVPVAVTRAAVPEDPDERSDCYGPGWHRVDRSGGRSSPRRLRALNHRLGNHVRASRSSSVTFPDRLPLLLMMMRCTSLTRSLALLIVLCALPSRAVGRRVHRRARRR